VSKVSAFVPGGTSADKVLLRVPGSEFPVSDSGFPVPGSGFPVPGSGFPVRRNAFLGNHRMG